MTLPQTIIRFEAKTKRHNFNQNFIKHFLNRSNALGGSTFFVKFGTTFTVCEEGSAAQKVGLSGAMIIGREDIAVNENARAEIAFKFASPRRKGFVFLE